MAEWFVTMTNGYDTVARQHYIAIHHVSKPSDNDVADFGSKRAAAIAVKKADCCAVDTLATASVLA
jgi:hypothetical protein